nr:hypothetical protein [Halopseudomonas litoralis]
MLKHRGVTYGAIRHQNNSSGDKQYGIRATALITQPKKKVDTLALAVAATDKQFKTRCSMTWRRAHPCSDHLHGSLHRRSEDQAGSLWAIIDVLSSDFKLDGQTIGIHRKPRPPTERYSATTIAPSTPAMMQNSARLQTHKQHPSARLRHRHSLLVGRALRA